ncbi:sporulation initiation factor Spo0A C-terminal domain-containing protein, partial [Pseudomonas aeruginosa]|nr:sporulation initiation factor Spo0A C-terminal domain-containing protein [Pseudomonas aeruginosa]
MITKIRELLCCLGITANYTGFYYTSYAVYLAMEDMECLSLVTKYLYPEVAKHYHTTPACVERNIRTV